VLATTLLKKITDALDIFAPEKTIKIKAENIIRQPWMTPGLLAYQELKTNCIVNAFVRVNNIKAIWIL
jgi:hypothetical protein